MWRNNFREMPDFQRAGVQYPFLWNASGHQSNHRFSKWKTGEGGGVPALQAWKIEHIQKIWVNLIFFAPTARSRRGVRFRQATTGCGPPYCREHLSLNFDAENAPTQVSNASVCEAPVADRMMETRHDERFLRPFKQDHLVQCCHQQRL